MCDLGVPVYVSECQCDLTNCVIRAALVYLCVPVYAICMSLCDFVYAIYG